MRLINIHVHICIIRCVRRNLYFFSGWSVCRFLDEEPQVTVQKTPKHSVRLRTERGALSVNEAACRLMEVVLPMLAEQLSRSAVEQRINNGYTGRRVDTASQGNGLLSFKKFINSNEVASIITHASTVLAIGKKKIKTRQESRINSCKCSIMTPIILHRTFISLVNYSYVKQSIKLIQDGNRHAAQ